MTTWFTFAFIVMCASISYSLLGMIFLCTKSSGLGYCTQVIGLLSCTGNIALLIWGSIVRWQGPGRICSADYYDYQGPNKPEPYMWKSGKFMKVWLIILYVVYPLACCCLCMVAIGSRARGY